MDFSSVSFEQVWGFPFVPAIPSFDETHFVEIK